MTPETSPLNFRPFTRSDWTGLAGSEPFAGGHEPRIADLTVDGFEATAIVDARGLAILVYMDDEGEGIEVSIPFVDPETDETEPEGVALALASLRSEVSSVALEALGFRNSTSGGPYSLRGAIESYSPELRGAGPRTYGAFAVDVGFGSR